MRNTFLALAILSAASQAFAQTSFTATYSFTSTTGTNNPFAYNGTDIANLTEGGLSRTNLPVSSSAGNFRSTGFPLDLVVGSLTGSYDPAKYFEFSLTPASGYALNMSNITFGLGRSGLGPRSWAWASSVDNFATFTGDYSSLGASDLFSTNVSATNPPGAIYFITDTPSTTGTNVVLNLSGTSFQNLSAVSFRLYGWNSEATAGTGGLQGPLYVSGSLLNLNPVIGGPYWAADPAGGGSGTWTSSGTTWATSVGGGGAGQTQSDQTLIFADTAGTVGVGGGVTVSNGMTFHTTGYVVESGTITLAGVAAANNAIATDAGVTTTISSELAGTTGMTKSGSGVLILPGTNTFSGNAFISGGTLQIGSDAALGNAANDLANNGTLRTTGNLSLGAGRDITGNGTFDISAGTTLTVNGGINSTATTLNNSGTFDVQGSTRSLGAIRLDAAGTIEAAGAIAASDLTAPGLSSGTATIDPDIVFTGANKTTEIGAGGTLVLNGDISGLTGRITKVGAGTLIASGSNSTNGYRLGVADAATRADGGTLILTAAAASGTGQLQLNYGTLESTGSFTFANGLVIGGRSGALAVLGGTNAMVFSGSSNFYRGAGTSGELRFDVNNSTSLNGAIGPTSGGGSATGITIGGTGSLAINGDASALVDIITLQDAVDLLVNGTLGGPVNVGPGNAIGGGGLIVGSLHLASGAGFIFDPTKTLTVNGAAVTFGGFGIVDLIGFSPAVPNGSYKLIDGIANVSMTNLLNLGPANSYGLGGGRSAYFEIGSLTLRVVPEPSACVISTGALLAFAVAWRRRGK